MSALSTSVHTTLAPLSLPSTGTGRCTGKNLPNGESWEWAKLRKIALRQMDKFIDLFPLVLRNEDLTAVNDMRITCRRLEQILDLVYAKPRPRHIKKLRRRLKLSRRTLGRLRDCDALLAVAEHAIAVKSPDGDAWEILRDYLLGVRGRTAQITLRKLGRLNLAIPYLRVKCDFDLNGNHRNRDARAQRKRGATEMVYRHILRSLDRRWCDFAAAVEKSHSDPCEHVIHQMRIAAKRLRYLVEVMAKLHIPGSKDSLVWLKSLQQTVGTWHDLEIMQKLLRNILAHRKLFHVERLAQSHIEHLIRHNREIKKHSASQFFAMTRRSRDYQRVKKWTSGILAAGVPKGMAGHKRPISAPGDAKPMVASGS
jgi:CHAD domain-containing protein